MRAALIGCGIVGRRLGARLLDAGHDLRVHDRDRSATEPLLAAGATWAGTPRELGRDRDLLVSALPGPGEVESAVAGEDGLWAEAVHGAIHLETSTVGPDCIRKLAERAARAGVRLLDAPLSRGPVGENGPGITIWVGGDAATFDEARGVLGRLADHVTWCGGVGAAQTAKLVNNLVTQSLAVVLAEALAIGLRNGVPLEILAPALRFGTAQSRLLDEMFPCGVFRNDWRPGLRLDLALKDLELARDLARRHGIELAVTERAIEIYGRAAGRGWGELNAHAVVRLIEEQAGVTLRTLMPDADPDAGNDPLA